MLRIPILSGARDLLRAVRTLILDDSEDDACLLVKQLERDGFAPEAVRVDTAEAFRVSLTSAWDVIILDHHVPGFGALAALDLCRELEVDVPIIVVSGVIGEEAAAACMRRGAHDFVLKDNLARLAPAIEREIAEHHARRERIRMRADLQRSEELLVRSEKLRALGEMAAGVSHDLKNLLNPLSLYLQLVERAVVQGDTAEAKESIEEMRRILAHGVETIERLRDYGKRTGDRGVEPVDLDRLVTEATALTHPKMVVGQRRIRVVHELGAPGPVRGRPGELLSAIVNLLLNAADAMRESGKGDAIRVTTGADGMDAFVRIEDDGPGMIPEVAGRVFEPFFSTKGDGGTGLGLAMVHGAAERHRGRVTLETSPGMGATFTVWLPEAGPPPSRE
jgi:signal transduction histidine kinase